MKVRLFGCGKFSWLASESEDRPLSASEMRFMDRHRSVCRTCERQEEASALALNMLRESRVDALESSSRFDRRVLRRVRIQSLRAGFQFWSPAIFGAAIAAVALVAALQLFAHSNQLPIFKTAQTDARRIQVSGPLFPTVPIANRIERTE